MSLLVECVDHEFVTRRGPVLALRDVTFSVAEGEFAVLLGPSGCGKSTCLRLLAGLERPTAGVLSWRDQPIVGCSPDHTLIFQRPSLFPWLTATQNVAYGLRLRRVPRDERHRRARRALEQMGLAGALARYPRQLSGGMQQRVALARALVLDPTLLLMDEPLNATDPLLRSRLQQEIHAACRGRTVVFVTHSIREALTLADRVLVMTPQPGRIAHEIRPPGLPPRNMDARFLDMERDLEALLTRG